MLSKIEGLCSQRDQLKRELTPPAVPHVGQAARREQAARAASGKRLIMQPCTPDVNPLVVATCLIPFFGNKHGQKASHLRPY
jgi:hypothetical protein